MYTQIELRLGKSLLGGHAKPSHCLGIVFGNAFDQLPYMLPRLELRIEANPLLGGHAIPSHRLCIVFGNAFAGVIHVHPD